MLPFAGLSLCCKVKCHLWNVTTGVSVQLIRNWGVCLCLIPAKRLLTEGNWQLSACCSQAVHLVNSVHVCARCTLLQSFLYVCDGQNDSCQIRVSGVVKDKPGYFLLGLFPYYRHGNSLPDEVINQDKRWGGAEGVRLEKSLHSFLLVPPEYEMQTLSLLNHFQ